jgi:hypothetical protein
LEGLSEGLPLGLGRTGAETRTDHTRRTRSLLEGTGRPELLLSGRRLLLLLRRLLRLLRW